MIRVFDFECDKCHTVFEKFVTAHTEKMPCGCGGELHKKVSAPRVALDGTDPGFPGEYDKWARKREKEAKRIARSS